MCLYPLMLLLKYNSSREFHSVGTQTDTPVPPFSPSTSTSSNTSQSQSQASFDFTMLANAIHAGQLSPLPK